MLGFFASTHLGDLNTLVSIMVGLSTVGYIVTKSVFMVIDRSERKRRKRIEDLD